MDPFSIFIPVDRRHALATGQPLPDRSEGTALFADISGFTPLTEALAREYGPWRGAEELTRHLNRVYDALITEIERYGGSVISFSGDAVTCWYEGDDGQRAVASGLAIQAAVQRTAPIPIPNGQPVTIAVKVALAVGAARRFMVGNPSLYVVDVLAGSTLERMAAAADLADRNEVLVEAHSARQLGARLKVSRWRTADDGTEAAVVVALTEELAPTPWPPLAAGTLSSEDARPWLLPAVFERLRGQQGDFLAELRPAVALFVRFYGIDFDRDSQAGEKLDRYFRWVQSVVARYEGSLIQLTFGDKGSYLYAVFGAPHAHGDDAGRAVAAALELRAPPPHLDFVHDTQQGISGGRMRVGAYGSAVRRTYGVLGDETNMAARLMGKAAAGQILISERLTEQAGGGFRFQSLGAIPIKGRSEPLPVAQVLGRVVGSAQRPALLLPRPLVGRSAELNRWGEWLQGASTGVGQLIRLEGVAGIGKSHLLAEGIECALERGLCTALGPSLSTSRGTPYAPWRHIVRALLGLEEGGTEGEAATRQSAQLQERLADRNPEWLLRLPLLGELLGLPIPETAATAALEPKVRQAALFSLVVELLQSLAAEQPLLIALDDAHWMDEASLELTQAVARAVAATPLMLVLAQRPAMHGEVRLLAALDELPNYHHLPLSELAGEGIEKLVERLLPGGITAMALSLIQAETQGNPFFVEELVTTLRESGALFHHEDGRWFLSDALFNALREANCLMRRDGHWVLSPTASLSAVELGLPTSIQGVVLARLDHLPEAHKLTLKVASVIGRDFSVEVLSQIHPLAPGEIELFQQLDLLEVRDFARSGETEQRPVYVFKHNVTREVAYETLLFAQRRELHSAIGEVLERLGNAPVAQLAYHTFAGEDWPRALRYQSQAGRQAQQAFAMQEAVDFFRKALHAARRLPEEERAARLLEVLLTLGELCVTTGQYEAAQRHLDDALALAQGRGDAEAQGRACRWQARLAELRSDFEQALSWVEQGVAALGGQPTVETVECLVTAGQIRNRQGAYARALANGHDSLPLAAQLANPSVTARVHNLLASTRRLLGARTEALDDARQALALYQQGGDLFGQGQTLNLIATLYQEMGDWPEAARTYEEARGFFNQLGARYQLLFVENNLGNLALSQGRLDQARALFESALAMLQTLGGSPYVQGALRMNIGAVQVRAGEVEGAREALGRAHDLFEHTGARTFLPETLRLLAEASLSAGETARAADEAQQALALAQALSMRSEEGNALRVLGAVARTEGNPALALQHLRESVALLDELGEEYEAARSRLALATLLLRQGERTQAWETLRPALATFERLEARLDLEAAHRLAATAQGQDGRW